MSRVHRVGTMTLGITLLLFGGLFLVHLFLPTLTYSIILQCWPVVFILLGIEVLIASIGINKVSIVYDKAGIAITAVLIVFTMGVAFTSMCFEYATKHMVW